VDAMQRGSSTSPRRVYEDYGAVLTDNADDSAAVQAAANAIPASGGTLWHPGGTAVVNSIAISGKSNVRIAGPGTYSGRHLGATSASSRSTAAMALWWCSAWRRPAGSRIPGEMLQTRD
jgi:hypothetical protein